MSRRLVELILAAVAVGLTVLLMGPVAATILTPDWLESADGRDWAGMTFFVCWAVALLFLAWRLTRPGTRPARGLFSARDWWGLAALSILATTAAAIASHWAIALPGLLPAALCAAFARRRMRAETMAQLHGAASPAGHHRPDVVSRDLA